MEGRHRRNRNVALRGHFNYCLSDLSRAHKRLGVLVEILETIFHCKQRIIDKLFLTLELPFPPQNLRFSVAEVIRADVQPAPHRVRSYAYDSLLVIDG